MLKDYLTKYYTDVLKLQYNMNLPKAQKPVTPRTTNDSSTGTSVSSEINTTQFA